MISTVTCLADHIVSGVMFYEWLSQGTQPNTNRYQITLRLIANCSISQSIETSVDIGIYRGTPGNYAYVRTVKASQSSRPVDLSIPPSCADLNGICVLPITYQAEVTDLPNSSENYMFAYQRCCRNMTINNIIDPGRTGSTIMIEMTPESQKAGNSSPKFDKVSQFVACINEKLSIDLKGLDNENDSVRYELCAPYIGGGPRGLGNTAGDPSECGGISPNPSLCVPPLKEITFANTNFTALTPFPSATPITLINGVLSAQPNTIGQYIFGICVYEYRNGLLFSRQRRDLQINFTQCNFVIQANVSGASVINGTATLNSCNPGGPFKIINTSKDSINIKHTRWELIGPKGNLITSDSFHFNKVLPDTGTYTGKLVLNRGISCSDSINLFIQVGAKLTASISTLSPIDTCSLGPITFATAANPLPKIIHWDLGDGSQSDSVTITHVYNKTGTYDIRLKVSNDGQCFSEYNKSIKLFPLPSDVSLKQSDTLVCFPGSVKIGLKEITDSSYTYSWTLSDGRTFKGSNPNISITTAGTFTVKLLITSPVGCKLNKAFSQTFTVSEKPKAAFDVNSKMLPIQDPNLMITNKSSKADKYFWDLGDHSNSTSTNPSHLYSASGIYTVKLTAISNNGCIDSIQQEIIVGNPSDIYVPNVFTPNGDGKNDLFKPEIPRVNVAGYEMSIYDRWGGLLFITKDLGSGWDGRNQSGQSIPSGVYIYQIRYSSSDQATKTVKGSVTLIE